jgi:hypothetical protein
VTEVAAPLAIRPVASEGAPMFKARLPLLVFALVLVGCGPARHTVRLRMADGQVRVTTPLHGRRWCCRRRRSIESSARSRRRSSPSRPPLELARERFEVPVREGVYIFNARTKELKEGMAEKDMWRWNGSGTLVSWSYVPMARSDGGLAPLNLGVPEVRRVWLRGLLARLPDLLGDFAYAMDSRVAAWPSARTPAPSTGGPRTAPPCSWTSSEGRTPFTRCTPV